MLGSTPPRSDVNMAVAEFMQMNAAIKRRPDTCVRLAKDVAIIAEGGQEEKNPAQFCALNPQHIQKENEIQPIFA
jgi:hypothetical protein